MGTYSFKSSGKTQAQKVAEALEKTATPIGIKTPLRLGEQDGIFAMNYSLAEQMHDNFRNLLMTNWGERLSLYDFGANLRPLMSEFTTLDNFDAQAIERISGAAARWMPYISLEDFISDVDRTENKNTAVIRITVTYNIQALNVQRRALQIVLYAM